MKWAALGDQLIWDKGIVARSQHAPSVILHEGVRLDMQVSQHFVRAPAPNEADDVGVDLCK